MSTRTITHEGVGYRLEAQQHEGRWEARIYRAEDYVGSVEGSSSPVDGAEATAISDVLDAAERAVRNGRFGPDAPKARGTQR